MPEYRWEPVTGTWVVLATNRQARPFDFPTDESQRGPAARCPFCQGNEADTPRAVLNLRDGQPVACDNPPWDVRVVPNLYGAVDPTAPASSLTVPPQPLGHSGQPGYGFHEVVIEAAQHAQGQSDLTLIQFQHVLRALQLRMQWLAAQPGIQYAQLFRNRGADAGASLAHLHSQIIAIPGVPPTVLRELECCRAWHRTHGSCLLCDMAQQARQRPRRVVAENELAVAYCPAASRVPFELWVQPRQHQWQFEQVDEATRRAVGEVLHRALRALEAACPGTAYNFWLHTSPFISQRAAEPHESYHWHVEVFPRQTKAAGFEWGTGWSINSLEPEQAAQRLRQQVAADP